MSDCELGLYCGWTKKKHGFWANSHSISIPQVVYNVKFLLGIVGRSRRDFEHSVGALRVWCVGYCSECSVLFYVVGTLCKPCWYWLCGFFIYNVLLFYTITKPYEVKNVGSLCTMRGGSSEGQNLFRLCSFPEQ